MPLEMATLHTGRTVPRAYLISTVGELRRLLSGMSLPEIYGGYELAQLASSYLARGQTAPVREPEARQALMFGYEAVAATGIMTEGRFLHSVAMDILAASLANPTETGYDVLDPLTGELVEHRELI